MGNERGVARRQRPALEGAGVRRQQVMDRYRKRAGLVAGLRAGGCAEQFVHCRVHRDDLEPLALRESARWRVGELACVDLSACLDQTMNLTAKCV